MSSFSTLDEAHGYLRTHGEALHLKEADLTFLEALTRRLEPKTGPDISQHLPDIYLSDQISHLTRLLEITQRAQDPRAIEAAQYVIQTAWKHFTKDSIHSGGEKKLNLWGNWGDLLKKFQPQKEAETFPSLEPRGQNMALIPFIAETIRDLDHSLLQFAAHALGFAHHDFENLESALLFLDKQPEGQSGIRELLEIFASQYPGNRQLKPLLGNPPDIPKYLSDKLDGVFVRPQGQNQPLFLNLSHLVAGCFSQGDEQTLLEFFDPNLWRIIENERKSSFLDYQNPLVAAHDILSRLDTDPSKKDGIKEFLAFLSHVFPHQPTLSRLADMGALERSQEETEALRESRFQIVKRMASRGSSVCWNINDYELTPQQKYEVALEAARTGNFYPGFLPSFDLDQNQRFRLAQIVGGLSKTPSFLSQLAKYSLSDEQEFKIFQELVQRLQPELQSTLSGDPKEKAVSNPVDSINKALRAFDPEVAFLFDHYEIIAGTQDHTLRLRVNHRKQFIDLNRLVLPLVRHLSSASMRASTPPSFSRRNIPR